MQTFHLSAEEARRFGGEMVPLEGAPQQAGRLGFTLRVPLGVVCAITPFNAPLNTVAHKVAPALAAGNAVVLKPSSHTPTTGQPDGRGAARRRPAAGAAVGAARWRRGRAGAARRAGGALLRLHRQHRGRPRDPAARRACGARRWSSAASPSRVLHDDANLDAALPKVVNAAYRKAGQVCTSIQILLVQRRILAQVEERLGALVRALPFGDPGASDTIVGPVISEAEAQRIERWIDDAVAAGAERLAGGPRRGAVVPPTLLTRVRDAHDRELPGDLRPGDVDRAVRHAGRGDRAHQRHAVRPGHGPVHQPARRRARRPRAGSRWAACTSTRPRARAST